MHGAALIRQAGCAALIAAGISVSAGSASACEELEEGSSVSDEVGRIYNILPSARPFTRGEKSVIQTPQSAAGGPQDVKFFGCSGGYAYVWFQTFGGYAGIVGKDPDAGLANLHESAPGISVGCTAVDGPRPNFCALMVTTQQNANASSLAFGFSVERTAGEADLVCLGLSLEDGSTMRIRVDERAEHAQTVAHSSCFDAATSAAIIEELNEGSTVQVQVKHVGESGYQTIHGDTIALQEAFRFADFLQTKMMAGQ